MNNIDWSKALFFFNQGAALLLFLHCAFSLNRMNHRSNWWARGCYVLAAVGAAGTVIGPLYGYVNPQPAEVLSNLGVTGLLAAGWLFRNRRLSDVREGP
jgi:hypothetical protein